MQLPCRGHPWSERVPTTWAFSATQASPWLSLGPCRAQPGSQSCSGWGGTSLQVSLLGIWF